MSSSSSTAASFLSSSSSSSSSFYNFTNFSSSSTGVYFNGPNGTPSGLATYGALCFISVVVFTGYLVWYYARPKAPPMVAFLTFMAWLCAFSVCFLVPIDLIPGATDSLNSVWSVLFWCSFLLMWIIIPIASGYYDNGGFTFKQKMRASMKLNAMLFAIAGVIALIGVIYLTFVSHMNFDDMSGLAIAASNTWGLVMLTLMAGYGLVAFPRDLWNMSHLQRRREELCFHASSIHDEADTARDDLHYTLLFLKSYQTRVDESADIQLQAYFRDILNESREKEIELQGMRRRPGQYDRDSYPVLELLKKKETPVDLKHMMRLFQYVKGVVRHLSLVEAQWRDIVQEYVDIDAAIGNERTPGGRPPPGLNCCKQITWFLRIRFLRNFLRVSAVFAALLSALLIWMEFFLPFNFNASPLGAIIRSNAVRNNPLALQLFSVIPITYLSICAYYPLFKIRFSQLYYIGPHRTDENTLLFNATFMLRVATPLAFNFVLLLKMDAVSLVNFIGVIDVIPFFGSSFTTIFPWFIFIISFATLLNIWGLIGRMLNMQRFRYMTSHSPGDEESFQEMRDAIAEGQKLILTDIKQQERRKEQPQESEQIDSAMLA